MQKPNLRLLFGARAALVQQEKLHSSDSVEKGEKINILRMYIYDTHEKKRINKCSSCGPRARSHVIFYFFFHEIN